MDQVNGLLTSSLGDRGFSTSKSKYTHTRSIRMQQRYCYLQHILFADAWTIVALFDDESPAPRVIFLEQRATANTTASDILLRACPIFAVECGNANIDVAVLKEVCNPHAVTSAELKSTNVIEWGPLARLQDIVDLRPPSAGAGTMTTHLPLLPTFVVGDKHCIIVRLSRMPSLRKPGMNTPATMPIHTLCTIIQLACHPAA
jgi:hypothetical protein